MNTTHTNSSEKEVKVIFCGVFIEKPISDFEVGLENERFRSRGVIQNAVILKIEGPILGFSLSNQVEAFRCLLNL
jgi:hypothetical protein